MPTPPPTPKPAAGTAGPSLAPQRLSIGAIVAIAVGAASPLTVLAGIVPTGFAATGLTTIPAAFLIVAAILALFSVGWVTMARYVPAGYTHAYIAQGLGKHLAVGSSWISLISYTLLHLGLYGAIGDAAAPVVGTLTGTTPHWWAISLIAWALVSALGLARIDISGRLLLVLVGAEVVITVVFAISNLTHPTGPISADPLAPSALFTPRFGAACALAMLGFVGIEQTVLHRTRAGARAIPTATYTTLGLIALLYAAGSFAYTAATGADHIVSTAADAGPELMFTLAGRHLGSTLVFVAHLLFVTSVTAAMISFHHASARYVFALGRERQLPAAFGSTTRRTGSPLAGSLTHTILTFAVIVTYAVADFDPIMLFYIGGTSGAIGILTVLTLAAPAIARFLHHHRPDTTSGTRWRHTLAPRLAIVVMTALWIAVMLNLDTLLDITPDHPLRWIIPATLAALLALGAGWAHIQHRTRPATYARIGSGHHR